MMVSLLICHLAYGESFESVRDGKLHLWVQLFLGTIKYLATIQGIQRLPKVLGILYFVLFFPRKVGENSNKECELSMVSFYPCIPSLTLKNMP